jgi:hypothetical protein
VVNNLPLPAACAGVSQLYIRWVTTSLTAVNGTTIGSTSTGTNRIDNIFVRGNKVEYVGGFNGSTVTGTTAIISGLNPQTTYYYTVKAVGQSATASASSNEVTVVTYADQAIADYRTKASGNMTNPNIWEYLYDGTNYAAATQAPGTNNNVTIRATDSVFLDTDFGVSNGKAMVIQGVMNADTNFVFGNGSVTIAPASTFITAHPNGISTTGAVTTSARIFSDSANYVYTGTVAQNISSLPSPLKGNVIIYNTAGFNVSTNRTITAPGSFIVKSGAVVGFGTGVSSSSFSLTGTGNFIAESGSTLIVTSSNGISVPATPTVADTLGCIRVTGTRSFATGINYNFTKNDGVSISRMGTSFGTEITGINNLTINNPVGSLLNASDITVNGNLNLVAGKLTTGTYKVSLPAGASVTKTDTSWVIGNMEKAVATGTTSVIYEVGADAVNYTPVTLAFGNVNTAGNIKVNAVSGAHPNLATSVISSTKRLSFFATVTGSGGIAYDQYNAIINFTASNVLGSANTSTMIAGQFDGTNWTYPSVSNRTSSSITLSGLTAGGDLAIGEVNCTLSVTASNSGPVCYTNPANFFANVNGNNGAVTYSWVGPFDFTSTDQNPVLAFATGSYEGAYTVTVTDAFGCTATSTTNLVINTSTSSALYDTVCTSALPYQWNGSSYTESGMYSYSTTNAAGCDSIAYLYLTITTSTSNSSSASACDSYTWNVNGQTYTTSGSYTSVTGCATEILNLTITASTTNVTADTACNTYTWAVNNQTYTSSGSYTSTTGCHTEILNLVINVCSNNITLSVKAYLQGMYTGNGLMAASLYDLGESQDATATDSIEINLWSAATTATATAPNYSVKALLHTNGMASVTFPGSALGGSYYVAVRHRNSLETWSAAPITMASTGNSVDFSASATAAFGDGVNAPTVNMGGGVFALYSGDVNQDGTIDSQDMTIAENDASSFLFGYNASDCNGDGSSDSGDMTLIENNAGLFLFYARPY